MKVDIYVHADKDSVAELGEQLGFSGDTWRLFRFLGSEHKMTYEVDETGFGTLIAVDGRTLQQPGEALAPQPE